MSKKRAKKDWSSNKELFNKYIVPNLLDVKTLVWHYSTIYPIQRDVHSSVLEDLYRYIHTFNPDRGSLDTWIHIAVKRKVFAMEKRYRKRNNIYSDFLNNDNMDNAADEPAAPKPRNPLDMKFYKDNLSDSVFQALSQLKPDLRYPLLLICNGYSIKEITKFEYERGAISWMSHNAIKTRIKIAKDTMKDKIRYSETESIFRYLVPKINNTEEDGQIQKENDEVLQPPCIESYTQSG